jgi:hypothetical protein
LRFAGHVRTDGANHNNGTAAGRLLAFVLLLDLSREQLSGKIGSEDVDIETFSHAGRVALGEGLVRAYASSGYTSFTSGKCLGGSCADCHLQAIYPTEVLYDVFEGLFQDIKVSHIGSVNIIRTLYHVILELGYSTGKA